MGEDRKFEKFGHRLLIGIVLVTAALMVSIPLRVSAEAPADNPAGACETPGTATAGEIPMQASVAPGGGSTLRAEDPVTGEIAPLPLGIQESVSTSDEGLAETPDAGGGSMIVLQGRFRSYLKVTRDAAGQISASCSHEEAH